ncbi:unnamed protein product, partial [Vitis vinifera]
MAMWVFDDLVEGLFLVLLFLFLTITFSVGFEHAFKKKACRFGPPSYPFIGCLVSFYQNRRRLLEWYTDLLSESPSQTIVVHRLGARRTVVTANAANVEYVLKTNFSNFPKGKPFTEILGDLLGFGIFNVDGDLWSSQRKLASHEFSTKSLREFVMRILEEEVEGRLLPLLESAMEKNEFPVFQAGPRVCLGKEMAFIQMKYVVASILRRFEIRPAGSNRPVFVPLLTAHMAGGFKVVVRKRSGGNEP